MVRFVAWWCVVLGIAVTGLGASSYHRFTLEERSLGEERGRLVASRPFLGALGILGLVAVAIPVLAVGGDAGAETVHEKGVELAAFRDKEARIARETNARQWAGYWSSVGGERAQLVAPECRVMEPPDPAQCLETTSEALQPQVERARRNESRSLWESAGGTAFVLAGAIALLLLRRRPSAAKA